MIRRILNKIESIYHYRYFSRNEKGSYNFLLKKVFKSTDIDFLENIWKLDYFREILSPVSLNLSELKNVLVLAPHQDDEVIGCGGTLTKLAENNCNITIAFFTNGAVLSNPHKSPEIRCKEAQEVCKKLNADMIEIGIDNISMQISNKNVDNLRSLLNKDWDTIFTIWPIDKPPKHRLCSYLFGKLLAASSYKGNVVTYAVHTDLLPNYYVDITNEIDNKQALIELYPSQMSVQGYQHLSKGLDAWRSRYLEVSSKKRYTELFFKVPAIAYKDFQRVYEQSNSIKLFKGNLDCLKSFNKLKKVSY